MTREQTIGTAELAVHLGRAFPALSAYSAGWLAVDLERLERVARRDAERGCSEYHYDSEAGRRHLARKAGRWLVRLSELAGLAADVASETAHAAAAQAAGVAITFHGDPRGCCLLLTLPGHAEAIRV